MWIKFSKSYFLCIDKFLKITYLPVYIVIHSSHFSFITFTIGKFALDIGKFYMEKNTFEEDFPKELKCSRTSIIIWKMVVFNAEKTLNKIEQIVW